MRRQLTMALAVAVPGSDAAAGQTFGGRMEEQNQIELLTVPENPSPRLRRIAELSGALAAAKKTFHIMTHFSDVCELPWLAVKTDPGETRDIGQLMSEECGSLEESGRTDYGRTEIEAVANLLRREDHGSPELGQLDELMELEGLR